MSDSTYVGAAGPEAMHVDITANSALPSLAVVTAGSLAVIDRNGRTVATWTCTLSGQSASALRLTHTFAADGSDVPKAAPVRLQPLLTTPSGVRRCKVVTLKVLAL